MSLNQLAGPGMGAMGISKGLAKPKLISTKIPKNRILQSLLTQMRRPIVRKVKVSPMRLFRNITNTKPKF